MKRAMTLGLLCAMTVSLFFVLPVFAATPVVVDHVATTTEGTPTVIDRTGDTYDATGATPTIATDPNHGSAAFNGDVLTYTPNAGYVGTDEFQYKIVDEDDGDSNIATVSVTIQAVIVINANQDPVAGDDSATVPEDGSVDIDVIANDGDPDGDTVAINDIVSGPAHGSASPVAGKIRYRPDSHYNGPDSLTYTINDGNGGISIPATVTITVTPNSDPVASPDGASVDEDSFVDIDVLSNDSDAESDPLTITSLAGISHGSTSIVSGKVRYIPAADYNGPDSFTYKASDGHGGLSPATTVSVTVDPVNDPPTASGDSATVPEDGSVDINVLADDNDIDAGDTLSIANLSAPPHGTASVSSGKVHYEPDSNYNGPDSFTYAAFDGTATSNTVTVSVTVTPVNDAPVAQDDVVTIPEDAGATQVFVLAFDTDIDGDSLSISAKTNGAHGAVAITGGGSGLTYRPNHDYSGDDSFTYTITDGHSGFDTATVTVHVGLTNDAPVAGPDEFHVAEGSHAVALDILGNDSDPDGNQLIIVSKTAALHGTVTITGNGTGITYDPTGNYHGPDKFKYTITDGNGGFSFPTTVLITVDEDTNAPTVSGPNQAIPGQTVGSTTTKVHISWGATDAGSGVASYKLQVSTNGGSYKTIALPHATTKSIDRALSTNKHYRFRVRATDKEGNVSAYKYGPTLTPARASQESGSVVYVGSWAKKTTTKALNGSTRYSSTNTRSATYSFTGYDVGLIVTRYTSSGKAQILVDGVLAKTVDLDTSSTGYRKLVFARHFSVSGPHTIQIRPVGDGRVDIDGFVVLH